MTCSTIACARWSFFACSIDRGLLVNTAWCRWTVNSGFWFAGFTSGTRRTINLAVTCFAFKLNAVKPISATSAPLIHA